MTLFRGAARARHIRCLVVGISCVVANQSGEVVKVSSEFKILGNDQLAMSCILLDS